MTSRKHPREKASVAARTLPADLILEIVARSDAGALVRCAAASKLLRRDILSPDFIRGVVVGRQGVAPCILLHLCKKTPTLVHPATHKAASFCDDHLAPFVSRSAADLFDDYNVLTSRRGLILLERRSIKDNSTVLTSRRGPIFLERRRSTKVRPKSSDDDDLCVYDPMSGTRKFLSEPSVEMQSPAGKYVLLTAADGINSSSSSFLLLAVSQDGRSVQVQTASPCGTWSPITTLCDGNHTRWLLKNPSNHAVLRGGVIHWLEHGHQKIVSYDVVGTGKLGLVKLPPTCCSVNQQLHLATSSDGKLLKLLAIKRFTMYVWLQLPGGSDWSLDVVIDMEEKLRLLFIDIADDDDGLDEPVQFEGSANRTGQVVFLKVSRQCCSNAFFAFDLETKEVHMQNKRFSLLEIDLPRRLQTMKIFS